MLKELPVKKRISRRLWVVREGSQPQLNKLQEDALTSVDTQYLELVNRLIIDKMNAVCSEANALGIALPFYGSREAMQLRTMFETTLRTMSANVRASVPVSLDFVELTPLWEQVLRVNAVEAMPETRDEFASLVMLTSCRMPLGVCLWTIWVLIEQQYSMAPEAFQSLCSALVRGAATLAKVQRGGEIGSDGLTEIGVWPNSAELLYDTKTIPFAPSIPNGQLRLIQST